jgi:two-component system chemotaxis response regulator CheY
MPKHIMAVDDSKTMRDMVAFTLRAAGYQVTEAEDGQKALSASRTTQFDLIITDLNMPNLDGVSLIRCLRVDPKYRAVPILMLTTESDPEKKAEGRAAAATGWIVKPFDPEKLVDAVNRLCPLS